MERDYPKKQEAAGFCAGGPVRCQNGLSLSFLVPMESAESIVEPLHMETPEAIVEADDSLRVAHPVSQLMLTVEAPDSVEFFTLTTPVPLALPIIASPVTALC